MPTPNQTPPELGVYITGLFDDGILGDAVQEDDLIQWAINESVTLFILYELNNWRSGNVFTNTGKTLLGNFIAKCTAAGIKCSASMSGSANTVDAVRDQVLTATLPSRKFWGFTWEDEFWHETPGTAARIADFAATQSSITYAMGRLDPVGIKRDFYLGHPTYAEIGWMAARFPRLFTHDYRLWAEYSYVKQKWRDVADQMAAYELLPIASAENLDNTGIPAQNFSGNAWQGEDANGNVNHAPRSILDFWKDFCFLPGTYLGSTPSCFMAETYPGVISKITVGGLIIFHQQHLRGLNYNETIPITCAIPANFSVINITNTTAKLVWDNANGAVSYEIRVRPVGSSTWGYETSGNATTTVGNNTPLPPLIPGTQYEWQVRSVCTGPSYSGWSVSSFFTTTIAACSLTSNLTVSSIAETTATLNWDTTPGAIQYNVRWRQVGAGSWISQTGVSATTLNITGLSATTNYEFQVQTDCGGNQSAYTGSTLWTSASPACSVPAALTTTGITSSGVYIGWGAITGAVTIELRYRVVGSPTWIDLSLNPNINPYHLTGLAADEDYEFELRTNCGGATFSAYTATQNFHTIPLVPVTPPVISPGGIITLCPGDSVTLFSDKVGGNTWSTGATTNSIVVTNPGTYTVTHSGLNSNAVTVILGTVTIPSISISGPVAPIPNGAQLTYTATGVNILPGAFYRWEINGLDALNNQSTLTRNFNNGDNIQAFVTNPGSCNTQEVSSNILQIQYPPGPLAPSISSDTPCLGSGGYVTLTSSWPGGNQWSNGETTRSIIVSAPGTYTVQAIDQYGVFSSDSLPFNVVECVTVTVPPMARVGPDASFGEGGAVPEILDPINLRTDNPFATSGSRIINYPEGLSTLNRKPLEYIASEDDIYHLVTDFDTLNSIAAKYYGDDKLYWVVQDINKLENSWELSHLLGKTLLIPDLDKLKLQRAQ